jgi:putative hydrolase of the HAD superfamily
MHIDDARRERFRRVFRAIGIGLGETQVDLVASAYRAGYVSARRVVDGAVALLEAVKRHASIAIVSNNLADEQREKLEFCGLAPFVDVLIVSEEAGMSKPDPAIFQIALDRVGATREEAVMLGDSWAADIAGAARAGIRSIWFNPRRAPMPPDPPAVAEIHSLMPASAVVPLLLGVMPAR